MEKRNDLFLQYFLQSSGQRLKSFSYQVLEDFLRDDSLPPREADVSFACLEGAELSCYTFGELDDFIHLNYWTARPLPHGIAETRAAEERGKQWNSLEFHAVPLPFQTEQVFRALTNGKESIVYHGRYIMHAFRVMDGACVCPSLLEDVTCSFVMKQLAYHVPDAMDETAFLAAHPGAGHPGYEYTPDEILRIRDMSPWHEKNHKT